MALAKPGVLLYATAEFEIDCGTGRVQFFRRLVDASAYGTHRNIAVLAWQAIGARAKEADDRRGIQPS